MKTRRSRMLATIGMLCALGGAAAAQTPPPSTIEAEQLFRDGKRLMDAGDYRQACEAFEGSLRKDPAVSTLLNLGNCREKNQQYASAWGHFLEAARRARTQPGASELVKVAEQRAAQLEPRLSYLIINVADDARVEGLVITRNGEPVDPASWNRDIPVDGGAYKIEGKAPAYEPWSTTVTVQAAQDKQSVNVPRFATLPADTHEDGDEDGETPAPASSFTGKRKLAVGAWSLGAVALGTGVALELKSAGTYDDAQAAHDNAQRHDLTDDANRQRRFATIAAGVGVAAVAAGIYLWIDGKPRARGEVALVPQLTHDGAAAVLLGKF